MVISSSGKPWPGATRTTEPASTYGTISSSVTATIGTFERDASRRRSVSVFPTQTSTAASANRPDGDRGALASLAQEARENGDELARAGHGDRPGVALPAAQLAQHRQHRERAQLGRGRLAHA